MSSLLLDTATWDLTVDAAGNIALANSPYCIAQEIACASRLFSGELWYDVSQGLPYATQILGQPLSATYLKALFVATAKTVPTVASAKAVITGFSNRGLVGQVQATLTSGAIITLTTGTGAPAPWYVSAITP